MFPFFLNDRANFWKSQRYFWKLQRILENDDAKFLLPVLTVYNFTL